MRLKLKAFGAYRCQSWRSGRGAGYAGSILSGHSATTLSDAQDDEHTPMGCRGGHSRKVNWTCRYLSALIQADAAQALDLFIATYEPK